MKVKQIAALLFATLTTFLVMAGVSPARAQASQVYITTQRFEGGLLVWRADNATIYALLNDGRARVFPVQAYSSLPENGHAAAPGGIRPLFGFGKVWANHVDLRAALGNPLLPEIGFNTSVQVINATLFITELDGTMLQINPDATWQRLLPVAAAAEGCDADLFFNAPTYSTDGVCPASATSAVAAFQPFERGFMIWLADAAGGGVWVFAVARPGEPPRWKHFPESSYATLDAAAAQSPPGRLAPGSAFGRVWAHLLGWTGTVRDELGWATAPESAYTATRQLMGRTGHVHTFLSLPDGRVVDAYQGLAGIVWTWAKG